MGARARNEVWIEGKRAGSGECGIEKNLEITNRYMHGLESLPLVITTTAGSTL